MAAPKGNKFALGNPGKPKKWGAVEELQADINAYFKWCDDNPLRDRSDTQPEVTRPYTIEGLCAFLECDRVTLINYQQEEGYEEYFSTIKAAKNKIQQNKVERALSGLAPAATSIFDLKNNHGYRDKQETEHSGNVAINKIERTIVKPDE